MVHSKASIISRSLALAGVGTDFISGSLSLEEASEKNFASAFNRILGRHSWSAFIKSAILSSRQDVPNEDDFRYCFKYGLPSDFSRLFACATNLNALTSVDITKLWTYGDDFYYNQLTNFELKGSFIYTNSDQIAILYQHNDFDSAGPLQASFVSALEFCLAALFALNLKQDKQLMDRYFGLFERETMVAQNKDALSLRERYASDTRTFGTLS